ncbi:sulfotransferase family 2 domain-containing protein [Pseudodonghicola xiamenensis]|uniref:Sulfotransferase family protein n=1 Tax=Pseudodonghicola xiamenensis TaxID=337702 RepID=A0A8J3H8J2_9RHOB|nr:sulfotransferase family 2 domain-containing protein [Pseudodonghicola xiamenensis]GHG98870.1 hypothetical protein GCM10010961_34450 [Pseudodonghicola xiamenensis]
MISHPLKTLFVHIPKTGGQSIESVFLKDAGLSWAERGQLCLGRNRDPARGPTRLAHLYADEYVRCGHISGAAFDAYLKFAIVRHPYERVLSEYRYRAAARRKRGDPPVSFDAFIRLRPEDERLDLARHLVPQNRYVSDAGGRLLVDRVLHLERLEEEVAPLFQKIFRRMVQLPHQNASAAGDGPRRADLSTDQKRYLQERYAEDFAAFGYEG